MPVRTCVVTRKRHDSAELVRLQIDEHGVLVVASPGGRGAWVNPSFTVVQKLARKPGMVRRSLRRQPSSTEGLVERVRAHLMARMEDSLRLAWRSGVLREQSPQGHSRPQTVVAADFHDCPDGAIVLPWTAAQLGGLLRRPAIRMLVALPSRPTSRLLGELHRWCCLGYPPAPLAVAS